MADFCSAQVAGFYAAVDTSRFSKTQLNIQKRLQGLAVRLKRISQSLRFIGQIVTFQLRQGLLQLCV